MAGEIKFFSYKIMPVSVNSFAEFEYSEEGYSREDLEDEVKQEMLSRGVEIDLDSLCFTVKEGYLFGEGCGYAVEKGDEAALEEHNSFHLLKRLIMLSNEILSEFQQRIFGSWCNAENGKKYTIVSKRKIIMTQQGCEPVEFNYELSVGKNGYFVEALGQKLDIEMLEETEKKLTVKISNGRTVTLTRC